eukprot:2545461-Amphidinium_carterae.2
MGSSPGDDIRRCPHSGRAPGETSWYRPVNRQVELSKPAYPRKFHELRSYTPPPSHQGESVQTFVEAHPIGSKVGQGE